MAKYYYTFEGRTLGPVAPKEIMSLILDDTLNNSSYVMDTKAPTWKKINEIPELMRYLHESDFKLPAGEMDIAEAEAAQESAPLFFYIPTSKLILYSIISLGWYEVYWFYRNWHFLRYNRKRKTALSFWRDAINPFAWVNVFYNISTDSEMNKAIRGRDFTSNGWSWFVWMIMLSAFASNLVSFVQSISYLVEVAVTIVALWFSLWTILPVQKYINSVNDKLRKHYSVLGFGHYAILGLGIFGWIISLSTWLNGIFKLALG